MCFFLRFFIIITLPDVQIGYKCEQIPKVLFCDRVRTHESGSFCYSGSNWTCENNVSTHCEHRVCFYACCNLYYLLSLLQLNFNFTQIVLTGGLTVSLLSTYFIAPFVLKFFMKRWYGIYLICLYVAFLVTAILTEANIIKVDVSSWGSPQVSTFTSQSMQLPSLLRILMHNLP